MRHASITVRLRKNRDGMTGFVAIIKSQATKKIRRTQPTTSMEIIEAEHKGLVVIDQ